MYQLTGDDPINTNTNTSMNTNTNNNDNVVSNDKYNQQIELDDFNNSYNDDNNNYNDNNNDNEDNNNDDNNDDNDTIYEDAIERRSVLKVKMGGGIDSNKSVSFLERSSYCPPYGHEHSVFHSVVNNDDDVINRKSDKVFYWF